MQYFPIFNMKEAEKDGMDRGATRIFGKWGKRRRQKQKKVLHERGFSKLKASRAKKESPLRYLIKRSLCIGFLLSTTCCETAAFLLTHRWNLHPLCTTLDYQITTHEDNHRSIYFAIYLNIHYKYFISNSYNFFL